MPCDCALLLNQMADQPSNPSEENKPDGDASSFQGFSQDDIDAALSEANAGQPDADSGAVAPAGLGISQDDVDAALSAASGAETPTNEGASGDDLSQADIDAAMAGALGDETTGDDAAAASSDADLTNPDGSAKLDSQGRPFDEAAAAMAAAIEEERAAAAAAASAQQPAPVAQAVPVAPPAPLPPAPPGAAPLAMPDFGAGGTSADDKEIGLLGDVRLDVKIELGRTDLYIEEVLKLGNGSVVELDRLAGDPVDVIVNDRLVARGEVLVLNDNFCVRISEILACADEH